jgi:hypothetical protein
MGPRIGNGGGPNAADNTEDVRATPPNVYVTDDGTANRDPRTTTHEP